ncbi:MAG TPA: hypothetical protein VMH61_08125 [Candidatus Acidoferrales bacterium]|nr:hypothetical protein [Candidatus Acidoferrales bacterium]
MSSISRATVRQMMQALLQRQGKSLPADEGVRLQEIGFRSLDFAELALRVETKLGGSMQFETSVLRSIQTVRDVLDFMERAAADGS